MRLNKLTPEESFTVKNEWSTLAWVVNFQIWSNCIQFGIGTPLVKANLFITVSFNFHRGHIAKCAKNTYSALTEFKTPFSQTRRVCYALPSWYHQKIFDSKTTMGERSCWFKFPVSVTGWVTSNRFVCWTSNRCADKCMLSRKEN